MQIDNEAPLVSVIVPVYKVLKYLKHSINSVKSQSFTDWEMILVDDGTPDYCEIICDEYTAGDSRIKVIHQKNAGVSAARNAGIDVARGKYLFFLDPDDFLNVNALERLVETARRFDWPDYVKGNHVVLKPDGELIVTRFDALRHPYENQLLDSTKFLNFIILIHPMVWNGLISREFIERYSIRFNTDFYEGEDLIFHLSMIGDDFKCVYTSAPTYIYRIAVGGSLSNTVNNRLINSFQRILHHINLVIPRSVDEEMRDVLKKEKSRCIERLLLILPKLPRKVRSELLEQLCQEISISDSDIQLNGLRVRIVYRLLKISKSLFNLILSFFAVITRKSKRIDCSKR